MKTQSPRALATLDPTWQDIGRFAESLRNAQRELLSGAHAIRDEFSLGPHGIWILGLISAGGVKTQSDVVRRYGVGRSMIAEEIALLTKAGLVVAEKSASDRRQVDLSLTPAGLEVSQRLGEALALRIRERLGGRYTLKDLQFCAELLRVLGGTPLWMDAGGG